MPSWWHLTMKTIINPREFRYSWQGWILISAINVIIMGWTENLSLVTKAPLNTHNLYDFQLKVLSLGAVSQTLIQSGKLYWCLIFFSSSFKNAGVTDHFEMSIAWKFIRQLIYHTIQTIRTTIYRKKSETKALPFIDLALARLAISSTIEAEVRRCCQTSLELELEKLERLKLEIIWGDLANEKWIEWKLFMLFYIKRGTCYKRS